MGISTSISSMTAPKKSLRGGVLMLGLSLVFLSLRHDMKYTRSIVTTTGELDNTDAITVLQEAQRQTRIKFINRLDTRVMADDRTKLDVNTVKFVKNTMHYLLEQVEEETGSEAKISVELLKDTLYDVMEQIEMEAIAATGTLNSTNTIQGAPSFVASDSVRPRDHNIVTGTSVAASDFHPDGPKIAIYMTTHVSEEHLEYLAKCWPAAMARLDILKNADLIVYTSSRNHDHIFHNLGFQNVTIYRYDEAIGPINAGVPTNMTPTEEFAQKQKGALTAMVDPWLANPSAPEASWVIANTSWFDAYDWVIRLNPDVMIRDDQWLLQQMRNTSIQGIFVKWYNKHRGIFLHTDFQHFDHMLLISKHLSKSICYKPSFKIIGLKSTSRQDFGACLTHKYLKWHFFPRSKSHVVTLGLGVFQVMNPLSFMSMISSSIVPITLMHMIKGNVFIN